MPREGTKSKLVKLIRVNIIIEIRYAPGGDEKGNSDNCSVRTSILRLDMPREGTKRGSRSRKKTR